MNPTILQKLPEKDNGDKLVTQKYCNQRAWLSRWMFGAIFTLMTLFLCLVGFAAKYSNSAANYAKDAVEEIAPIAEQAIQNEQRHNLHLIEFKAQQTLQAERDRTVVNKLDQIQIELKEQRNEQKRLLERILTKATP